MNYKIEKLKDVAQVITGKTPSTSNPLFYGGNISFISPADLNNSTIGKTKITLTEIGAKQVPLLPKNSVLVSCIGNLGKVGILDKSACFNQQINALVFDESKILPKYGFYFSLTLQKALEKAASKTVIPIVNKSKFSDLEISYPDLPTQTKIAQILDKADQIRQKRKKAIELADEFLRSLFLEMFGDPVVNPKGWEVEKLVNLSVAKPTYGAGASAISYNHKFRYIRITDILENGTLNNDKKSAEIDEKEIEKYLLNDGDILFARSGATVGKTFLFTDKIEKSIYAGYLIRFQINKNKVLPEYIFNFTKTAAYQSWVKSHMKTVAQPNINAQQYSDLEIIIPPMEIQIKFVEIVNKIEKYKENLGKQVQFSDELFNSLSQQYFTKAE
ncbi:hypothetical protein X781_7110 [Mannheimia sp. USDA-ARS-USMARC-1261]|uniref:restriction endonuclease subunit S n=1 Tax=Mannheimia sp. USDA-ARS-USMARC-1261 TaxID=1432056 RepID=UPI0003E3E85F|nr:restriction endonuclease subunit S [Mannheimia sp. USDA-ARS-USMARC-1261]AHG72859.1 hypothetical protein X781_7110 [Mannheimia sp. USDA-ARS-USMARC-1261]